MPTPQREILWNVPPAVTALVYGLSALSAAWIAFWFVRRSRLWARGAPAPDQRGWRPGLVQLVKYLLIHRTIRRDPYAGWMHLLLFWGFVALLIATTLVGIQYHFKITFLTGTTYLAFSLFADLGGVAFCTGVGMALWRRRISSRLLPSAATTAMLWLMMGLAVSGFLVEGARIARDFPPFERWSPVGYLVALAMAKLGIWGDSVLPVHLALWCAHAALFVVFFALVPVTVLKHIVLGAYSVMRPAGRPGLLHEPSAPVITAVDLPQFRQLDWLQADACLTCGRCTSVCPAQAAGKPLDPRSVVLALRQHLDRPEVSLAHQVADDTLWSCTTCQACDDACPINIHVVAKIVTLRQGRVAVGELPNAAVEALGSTAQKFNPFNRANSARMEWASGLTVPLARAGEAVDLLYWVGCAGAFDPAGRAVTRAMIQILDHLRISYRVLGCGERCTGDPARRLGEEGLWRELAEHNQQGFTEHQVKTVLTQCPHCFNAFRNEYPVVGPMPVVVHHSQFLRDRLADGSLKIKSEVAETITFHDPCYLSRANDETAAPRAVLDRLSPGRRLEMVQHGQQSFCCGGGGGQLWLDVRGQTRVESIRAGHVEETGARTVATACPFCRVMLETGRASLGEGRGDWRVRDVAELVAENLA